MSTLQKVNSDCIQGSFVSLPPHMHDGETWFNVEILELMAGFDMKDQLVSIQYDTTEETYSEYVGDAKLEVKYRTIYQSIPTSSDENTD